MELALEITIKANKKNEKCCHPYCNYLHLVDGHRAVLCRLFRTEKYLKTDTSGFSVEFFRCDECLAAQTGRYIPVGDLPVRGNE